MTDGVLVIFVEGMDEHIVYLLTIFALIIDECNMKDEIDNDVKIATISREILCKYIGENKLYYICEGQYAPKLQNSRYLLVVLT